MSDVIDRIVEMGLGWVALILAILAATVVALARTTGYYLVMLFWGPDAFKSKFPPAPIAPPAPKKQACYQEDENLTGYCLKEGGCKTDTECKKVIREYNERAGLDGLELHLRGDGEK